MQITVYCFTLHIDEYFSTMQIPLMLISAQKKGCAKYALGDAQTHTWLLLGRVNYTSHVQQAFTGLMIDENQERPIEDEPRRKSLHREAA